jgi:hypothetical protein
LLSPFGLTINKLGDAYVVSPNNDAKGNVKPDSVEIEPVTPEIEPEKCVFCGDTEHAGQCQRPEECEHDWRRGRLPSGPYKTCMKCLIGKHIDEDEFLTLR